MNVKEKTMKLKAFPFVLTMLLIAGCARSIPQAENFPTTQQRKAMAARHWEFIASDSVVQTKQALAKNSQLQGKPLYLEENTTTDFSRAFRKYMISELIDSGFAVSTKKEGAIEIVYEAQVIKHASAFDPVAFGYKPGVATAGVAGVWILREALKSFSFSSAGGSTLAAAGAYDAYKANNPGETGVELIISTSMIHQDKYVMLNADAYYIEKGEEWLFEGCKGRSRRNCK